jgi:AcrR family transcriptional regulator
MPRSGPPILADDEDLPAPPRQARSIAARKKILEAGRRLFAERGYHATSIQAIASRADAAAGAFYTHFRSKRQLLIVLMNELLQRLRHLDLRPKAGGTAPTDARASLRRFLAAVFRADLEYYGVVRAWQEAALTDAGLGHMRTAIEAWTGARILGVFRLLQNHPHARRDGDLPAFARMMDRHFWSLLARGTSLPRRDFEREVRIAADVIYRYLFRDPPPDTPHAALKSRRGAARLSTPRS